MGILPIIPDFDYAGFVMRVPYDSAWGHRGMTHSIFFSVLASLCVMNFFTAFGWRRWVLVFCFFFSMLTHALLDALTNGGLGVAFFAPYSHVRYFFPWQPIQVSPMGASFFSERGLVVLISEFFWIGIPCLGILLLHFLFKSRGAKTPKSI